MSDTLPPWAVPGRKVVCINNNVKYTQKPNSDGGRDHDDFAIIVNKIYTIRSVYWMDANATSITGYCITTTDHIRRIDANGMEPGYYIGRFRPLIETKTEAEDVAFFKDLLKTEIKIDEKV